ncbi:SWIM zinc finger family protein [Thermogemmatispora tikiterensis]|nr:SWIM zinc finger family protein [Thermogemmatispora tikiterensis]
MQDEQLQRKQMKAANYAQQPERFTLLEIKLQMRSTHGVRLISYAEGDWHCTCDFYRERGTCSHIMAAEQLLGSLIPLPTDTMPREEHHDPER